MCTDSKLYVCLRLCSRERERGGGGEGEREREGGRGMLIPFYVLLCSENLGQEAHYQRKEGSVRQSREGGPHEDHPSILCQTLLHFPGQGESLYPPTDCYHYCSLVFTVSVLVIMFQWYS